MAESTPAVAAALRHDLGLLAKRILAQDPSAFTPSELATLARVADGAAITTDAKVVAKAIGWARKNLSVAAQSSFRLLFHDTALDAMMSRGLPGVGGPSVPGAMPFSPHGHDLQLTLNSVAGYMQLRNTEQVEQTAWLLEFFGIHVVLIVVFNKAENTAGYEWVPLLGEDVEAAKLLLPDPKENKQARDEEDIKRFVATFQLLQQVAEVRALKFGPREMDPDVALQLSPVFKGPIKAEHFAEATISFRTLDMSGPFMFTGEENLEALSPLPVKPAAAPAQKKPAPVIEERDEYQFKPGQVVYGRIIQPEPEAKNEFALVQYGPLHIFYHLSHSGQGFIQYFMVGPEFLAQFQDYDPSSLPANQWIGKLVGLAFDSAVKFMADTPPLKSLHFELVSPPHLPAALSAEFIAAMQYKVIGPKEQLAAMGILPEHAALITPKKFYTELPPGYYRFTKGLVVEANTCVDDLGTQVTFLLVEYHGLYVVFTISKYADRSIMKYQVSIVRPDSLVEVRAFINNIRPGFRSNEYGKRLVPFTFDLSGWTRAGSLDHRLCQALKWLPANITNSFSVGDFMTGYGFEIKHTHGLLQQLKMGRVTPGAIVRYRYEAAVVKEDQQPVTPTHQAMILHSRLIRRFKIPEGIIDFVDFDGVVLVRCYPEAGCNIKSFMGMVHPDKKAQLLQRILAWPQNYSGEHEGDTILRFLISESVLVIQHVDLNHALADAGSSPAFFVPEPPPPPAPLSRGEGEEQWWERSSLVFPGGVEDAKLWGFQDAARAVVTLENPQISGVVRDSATQENYRLLSFGTFYFLGISTPSNQGLIINIDPQLDPTDFAAFFPPPGQEMNLTPEQKPLFMNLVDMVQRLAAQVRAVRKEGHVIQWTHDDVTLTLNMGAVSQSGKWNNLELIVGTPDFESGKLGLNPLVGAPLRVHTGAKVLGDHGIALAKNLGSPVEQVYLLDLAGLTLLHKPKNRLQKEHGVQVINPAQRKHLARLMAAGDMAGLSAFYQKMTEHNLPLVDNAYFVRHENGRFEAVARDGSFRLTFAFDACRPAETDEAVLDHYGQWQLTVYKDTPLLKAWGYDPLATTPFSQETLRFKTRLGKYFVYSAQDLVVLHDTADQLLYLYPKDYTLPSSTPVTDDILHAASATLFARGGEYVPIHGVFAPPGLRVEREDRVFYPGEPALEGATISVPFEEEFLKKIGMKKEMRAVAKPAFSIAMERDQHRLLFVGFNFLCQAQQVDGSVYYYLLPARLIGGNLAALKAADNIEAFIREKLSDAAPPILLFPDETRPGVFVPFHSLSPVEQRDYKGDFVNAGKADALKNQPCFARDEVIFVAPGNNPTGGVLVEQNTRDYWDWVLGLKLLAAELKRTEKKEKLVFDFLPIANPVIAAVEEILAGVTEVSVPSLTIELHTEDLEASGTSCVLRLQEGGTVDTYKLDFHPPPNPLPSRERGLYAGQKIAIHYGEQSETYVLQASRSQGFDLMQNGKRSGTITAGDRGEITLKIGDSFTIQGIPPKVRQIADLELQGSGGPRQLALFLDEWVRRVDDGAEYLLRLSTAFARMPTFIFPSIQKFQLGDLWAELRAETDGTWQLRIVPLAAEAEKNLVEVARAYQQTAALQGERAEFFTPRVSGEVAPVGDDFHPYHDLGFKHEVAPDMVATGQMRLRSQDAALVSLRLRWRDQDVALPVTKAHQWLWGDLIEGKWVQVENQSYTWKGLALPFNMDGVHVTRDLKLTFGPTGIVADSWSETRVYDVGEGEKIVVELTRGGGTAVKLSKALWRKGASEIPCTFSPAVSTWGETVKLKWQARIGGRMEQREYTLHLQLYPTVNDFNQTQVQTSVVQIPHQGGTFRLLWEQRAENIFVHVLEWARKDRTITLYQGRLLAAGDVFRFSLDFLHLQLGTIHSRIEIHPPPSPSSAPSLDGRGLGGGWTVHTPLEIGGCESAGGSLHWHGERTAEGLTVNKIILCRDGKVLVPNLPVPRVLQSTERLFVTFEEGSQLTDFILEYRDGVLNFTPVTLPTLPDGFGHLGDQEVAIPRPVYSDYHRHSGPRTSLPHEVRLMPETVFDTAFADQLTNLIHGVAAHDVFYPTFDSLQQMLAVVRRVAAGERLTDREKTVAIQLVSANHPLLIEETFVYHPEGPLLWRPVGMGGEEQKINHPLQINKQVRPAILTQKGKLLEWYPTPPGTTRLQMVSLPGRAGFFALINAAGAHTPAMLKSRREGAREGFHSYFSAQAAGMLENIQSRFSGSFFWDEDPQTGLDRVVIAREEVTETGVRPTKEWISLTAVMDHTSHSVGFINGRSFVRMGSGDQVTFEGVFQAIYAEQSSRLLFVQIDGVPGQPPRVFRASFLPGGSPMVAEIHYADLAQPMLTSQWLYDEGWVAHNFDRPQSTGAGGGKPPPDPTKKYEDPDAVVMADDHVRVIIVGDHPQADRTLLPYVISEQAEWQNMATVFPADITEEHVLILEEWLTRGASDFQLLPQSVVELKRLHQELEGLAVDRLREITTTMEPLHLWLINAQGVLLEVTLYPHVARGTKAVLNWVIDPEGKNNTGVQVRLVGRHPDSGNYLQIYAPATYDRTGAKQTLKVFSPTGLSGVLQTLNMTEVGDLILFYDATKREKPDDAATRALMYFSTPQARMHKAIARTRRLNGLVAEARETFVVTTPPLAPNEAEQGLYLWNLSEFEDHGQGSTTHKHIQLHLPRPEFVDEKLATVKIPHQLTMRSRVDFLDGADVWHDHDYNVYRTYDEGLLLVNSSDITDRYVLTFEHFNDRPAWPQLRKVRGFESGMERFYNPPIWDLSYEVDRVRSAKETLGMAYVEEVTGEYEETAVLDRGQHVHRYSFYVEEIKAQTRFDLVIDAEGRPVRVFASSWEIDGLKDELNDSVVDFEIVVDGDTQRIYLRHRPVSYEDAKGHSHFMTVDFRPNSASGLFLGKDLKVASFHYNKFSANPAQNFFPSEIKHPFAFVRKEGSRKIHEHGYYQSWPHPDGGGALVVQLRFYNLGNANDRWRLQFVLDPDAKGHLAVYRPRSAEIINEHTGKVHTVGAEEFVEIHDDGDGLQFVCMLKPYKFIFSLDHKGQPLADPPQFSMTRLTSKALFDLVRQMRHIKPVTIEAAQNLFEASFGVSVDGRAIVVGEEAKNLLGQQWADAKITKLFWREDEDEDPRQILASVWYEACLLFCGQQDVDGPLSSHQKAVLQQLADQLLKKEREDMGLERRPAFVPRDGDGDGDWRFNEGGHDAHAADEAGRDMEFLIRRLVDAGEDKLAGVLRQIGHGESLDEVLADIDPGLRAGIMARLQQVTTALQGHVSQTFPSFAAVREWLADLSEEVGEESGLHENLLGFLDSPVSRTGFGLSLIQGLQVYVNQVRKDEDDDEVGEEMIADRVTRTLEAAAWVYKTQNELIAERLGAALVASTFARAVDWDLRDKIMEDILEPTLYQKNRDLLESYRDFAVVLPFVGETYRDRIIRTLRRGVVGKEERSLLASLLDTEVRDNPQHVLSQWRRNYGVIRWLDPLRTDSGPTSQGGSPQGGSSKGGNSPQPPLRLRGGNRGSYVVLSPPPFPLPRGEGEGGGWIARSEIIVSADLLVHGGETVLGVQDTLPVQEEPVTREADVALGDDADSIPATNSAAFFRGTAIHRAPVGRALLRM